ncbi:TPA: hypothetical protein ACHTFF_003721 [Clostridioides difficile]|uniref:Uncharacterized protein n=2 Tax=root TaxID=1 RepID=A0A0A8WIC4_9CAUD|nr:hypothetical protein [Clostridioides difficile]YP_009202019.1 hypothetical protein PHICD506_20032 [Clostridium phage phiCD506]EGT3745774.1 hypothetical protein [Clostridioides difficile]EGT4713698.1 hypothetical protein [Clostridioides difficile]EGT4984487.1 hypothetical protein [Clostridioides difficile]EGT5066823.1 hypothetical protein [Clostridioides difficile]EQK59200.1 hypothetical protein C676_2832 [Clostridioides difficile F548]
MNVYLQIGKELSGKMTKSELNKFSQEVVNFLRYAGVDKDMKIKLFQTIIEAVVRKKVSLPSDSEFTEGILQSDEAEMTMNVGFLIEGLSYHNN